MKNIKFILILFFVIFAFNVSRAVNDEPNTGAGEEKSIEHQSLTVNESAEGKGEAPGEEHETVTPLVYYLNWIGLAVMCVIVFGDLRNNKKEKKHKENKKGQEFYEAGSEKPNDLEHISQKPVFKPILLIFMASLIFFCEQLPVLSGFHENLAFGYFRFIFKILIGVLMLKYGLSSLEEEHH